MKKLLLLVALFLLPALGCRTGPLLDRAKDVVCNDDPDHPGIHERFDQVVRSVTGNFGLPGLLVEGLLGIGSHFLCGAAVVGLEAAKVASTTVVDRPSEVLGLAPPVEPAEKKDGHGPDPPTAGGKSPATAPPPPHP
jgi:hypothetical protein